MEKDVTWTLPQPVPGEKVLDIGTGTANYLIELAERGVDCTGLDIGHKMLLRGRRNTAVFAPPGIPDWLIPYFSRLEPLLRKWAKPFGAYLVICKRQKP